MVLLEVWSLANPEDTGEGEGGCTSPPASHDAMGTM